MSARPTLTAGAGQRHALDFTPAEFARFVLGIPLYPWQEEMLEAFDNPGQYSGRCCNESGKTTTVIAPFVGWFFTTFAQARLVATAGVFRQVEDQLFPAIKRQAGKLEGWDVKQATLDNGRGGRGRGFRAVDPDFFEGYHNVGMHSPLAIIVDEAKSVADDIFTAVARCRPDWLIVLSSPGEAKGEFYRSQTSHRRFWHTFRPVTAAMCPHIPPARIAREIEQWGRDHWLVRSMIFAEFTRQDEAGAVVALSDAERAMMVPPPFNGATEIRRAGCDFAAGGDENVFALREGNRVSVVAAWRERNTMAAVDAFIMEFERAGFTVDTAGMISADADGLGGPMCDALAEKGWHVSRFNGNAAAFQDDRFSNRSSEVWNEFGADVRRGEWILEDLTRTGPDTLLGQLSTRKGRRDGKGRLALEKKEDLKRRGVESPDRADAVIMAACNNGAPFFVFGGGE